MWESDRWGRNIWGTPSDSNGDFAWIQHMFCSMKRGSGRVGVVMPQGVLFRGNKDGEFRKQMIQTDKLECVITLVNNLFYGAGVSACLLIFRDQKPQDHVGKVLLIDASRIYTAKRAQNELSDADVDTIYQLYADYADVEERSKVVTMRELEEHDWSLAVNSYITRKQESMRPYAEVKQEFLDAFDAVQKAEAKFMALLKDGGYIQ